MDVELGALLAEARAGELAPAEFAERVESLHARHLGGQIDAPEFVNARREAVAAYDELTRGRDRHHQLELIAQALGIGPRNERPGADLASGG